MTDKIKTLGVKLLVNGDKLCTTCCPTAGCPTSCSSCADTYTVSITGFYGAPCYQANTSSEVSRTTPPIDNCEWGINDAEIYEGGDFICNTYVLKCINSQWDLTVTFSGRLSGNIYSFIVNGTIPATSACPIGTYDMSVVTGGVGCALGTGTAEVTV